MKPTTLSNIIRHNTSRVFFPIIILLDHRTTGHYYNVELVACLLIKGLRFRTTKTKTLYFRDKNKDPAKRTAYLLTIILQQRRLVDSYNLF